MRIDNKINDTENKEVSKKPKLNFSFKKNGKKLDKSVVIVISTIVMFFLVIVYIFNLEDPATQTTVNDNSKINEVSQFDVKKISEAQNSQVVATPPPLTPENTNLENKEENQFDFNKISSLQQDEISNQNISETQDVKYPKDDFNSILLENNDLKEKVERLEREIRELKYSHRNITDKTNINTNKTIDEKVSNSETTVTDSMKDYLTGVKNDIQIKGDYFHLQGKNYYLGDKLNGYDVREIKKSSIRFCSNWCYTLIF